MNLSEMRTVLRRELHDEDAASYRWTSDELDRHITRAVRELSEAIPREQKATLATVNGTRGVDIASLTDRVSVAAVEYPAGRFPPVYTRFSLWGDTLTLLGHETPDGSNCVVYYGGLHTLDGTGSTVPTQYEDLVVAGAAGYAATEWALYAVNRVNLGGETTVKEFLAWGRERLNLFRRELARRGRRHRVRVTALYEPAYPVRSQTTDYGP